MNYIKRMKSLGFRKVNPIVVCEHSYPKSGYFVDRLEDALLIGTSIKYPRVDKIYYDRLQTYSYRISRDLIMYIILFKEEYTVVIDDKTVEDIIEKKSYGRYIISNQVTIPIDRARLGEGFWKYILSKVGITIQREITLKEILNL